MSFQKSKNDSNGLAGQNPATLVNIKIGHKWMFIVFIPPNHGIQGFNQSPKSIQVPGQSSCYHLLSFNRLTHFGDLATPMHSMPQEDPAQMDWYANSKDL